MHPDFKETELYNFYINDKLSIVDIAGIKNTNSKEISRYLHKYNIPIRNRSEAVALSWSMNKRIFNTKQKKGKESPQWKGGKIKMNGYVMIYNKNLKQKYEGEHRIVWEKHYGKLPKDFVVHHLNGVRDDNRIENLSAFSKSKHPHNTFVNILKERIRFLENQVRGT